MLKGKNSKKGAYTKDASEVLIAILIVIEEVGQCVPLIGGLLHFVSVQYDESFLSNEITEEENNPTKIHQ